MSESRRKRNSIRKIELFENFEQFKLKNIRRVFGFAGRDILTDTGSVSAITAKAYAETEFEKYRVTQDKLYQSDFDKLIEKSKKD